MVILYYTNGYIKNAMHYTKSKSKFYAVTRIFSITLISAIKPGIWRLDQGASVPRCR